MPVAVKKEKEAPSLKGKDAEQAILDYIKKINRPYGSSDVSANLKNAVSKPATQKILVALAEGGQIIQKTYGKATIFSAKQSDMEDVPPDKLKELTEELVDLKKELSEATTRVKQGSEHELSRLLAEPTDDQLDTQVAAAEAEVEQLRREIEPLRDEAPPMAAEEIQEVDAYWVKWRAEWKARRKVFQELFGAITDSMSRDQRAELEADLGIEYDSPEHQALEKSSLCLAGPKR